MRALLIGLSLLGAVAQSACAPSLRLELRDLDNGGRLITSLPLRANDGFSLDFTHSMYGGWVEETYVVSDHGALQRIGVRTERAGAAEYYALYGNLHRSGEAWVVEVAPLDLQRLPIRVDTTGRPGLLLATGRLELLSIVPDGHVVEVRIAGAHPRP